MKKINLAGLLLSLAMLGACAKAPAAESSETFAAVTIAENVTETTMETTAKITTTATEQVMETTAEITTETTAENAVEYASVSPDNEFIDYEFIENYQGTTDIGGLADKAVEFLKTTDFYADSMENIDLFKNEEFAPYIEDGVIVPKFNTAYPNDYDGDGKTETFIEVDMPYKTQVEWLGRFYIFADSGGNMSFVRLSPVWLLNGVKLLDYGRVKHIILGGNGTAGAESDSDIYCVENGECVSLYGGRHNYRKNNCFLYTTGWQGSGDFMYFDINEGKYFALYGEDISVETIKEMDTDNTLSEFYEWTDENNYLLIELIGKKYYVFSEGSLGMEHGGEAYVYENGKFIQDESCQYVRRSDTFFIKHRIVDIDAAIANMKKPTEPFVQVSPDNEFIDYEFIEDYQGTTDIGGLADKAVEFLTATEEYETAMSHFDEIDEEYGEPYIKDGKIVPQFNTAYPNDYDGDGTTETFIIVNMPFWFHGYSMTTSFFIFAGSGENMTLLDYSCAVYDTVFLDYGKVKQITFGGGGTMGAEDYQVLYGVADGKAKELYTGRGGFVKEDCFLSFFGWQGSGAFMYYDMTAGEYVGIDGVPIPEETIREMDTENLFEDYYGEIGISFMPDPFRLVGGKYYLVMVGIIDPGSVYVYEDGKFIYLENSAVRFNSSDFDIRTVTDIDIEQAIANMKKPLTSN